MYAGAALSLLDSVYLPLHLPSGTTFRTVLYGLPRVGNKALADYVDANLQNVMHINNLKDPVPIIPPRFMEYVHPSGEVHIRETGEWASCPGKHLFDFLPVASCRDVLMRRRNKNYESPNALLLRAQHSRGSAQHRRVSAQHSWGERTTLRR